MSPPAVPELTRIACIQLNERVSLWGYAKALVSSNRILSPSGPSMAKPPGEHTTLGGFVFLDRLPTHADARSNLLA